MSKLIIVKFHSEFRSIVSVFVFRVKLIDQVSLYIKAFEKVRMGIFTSRRRLFLLAYTDLVKKTQDVFM